MNVGYRPKQLLLLLGDFASYAAALWLGIALRNVALPTASQLHDHALLFAAVFCIWVVCNFINGLYDLGALGQTRYFYKRFFETACMSLGVSIVFFYFLPNQTLSQTTLTPKTLLALTLTIGYSISALWRLVYHHAVGLKKTLLTNVIFVGYTPEVQELIEIISRRPEKGYQVVTLIDPEKTVKPATLPGIDVYNGLHTVRPAISTNHAHLVVIAPHLRRDDTALRELYELLFWKVQISDLPSFYEIITGRIPPSTFSEGWFLDHLKNQQHPIYDKCRSLLDYIAAFCMAIVYVVLFPFLALAIKLNSPGPILISQKRVGQFGNIFTIYKLRSMYALSPDGSAEVGGVEFAVKGDKRITSVGKFLRRTRLDELPQCLNLWRREVTLIGPRPERPEIVAELQAQMPYYPLRHIIRPGITGWAAIRQHYTDTLETSLQKLQFDLYYIKNRSLLLDVSILLRTINVVIRMMGQ